LSKTSDQASDDPFAAVQPVAVDRLTPPKPVEINPAARDLIRKSHDSAQVLEIAATDDGHLKTLLKHLRAAAHDDGARLITKVDGLTLRFKASPKAATPGEIVEPEDAE
jgi:hypothetical protein